MSSSSTGPIRIGNFYSTFDTESIISQLEYARQAPIRQLDARQTLINQRKQTLTTLTTQFATLLSRTNTLFSDSSVSGKTASVSGTGVGAAASPTAAPGTLTVAVTALATGTSTTGTPLTAAVDAASVLSSSNLGTVVTAGSFTMKAATGALTTITVDPATQSLTDVITAINAATGTSGISATLVNDANGRANILQLDSTQGAIQLGNPGDTSNFLTATRLIASPGTTTRSSTLPIARLNTSATMSGASFFAGAPASGAHSFTINGVTINYDASVDSLSDVLGRINNSTAGVTATYDYVTDKVTLRQTSLGSLSMSLADDLTGGDFLARTGLLAAAQTLGTNAEYSIDGGATQYATSNTVTLPTGVTLTLSALTGGTPATVTVAQETSGAVAAMKSFVADFNALMQSLNDATKADKASGGPFSGDAAFLSLRTTLRSLVTGTAFNPAGKYAELGSLGLNFGAVGSTPGSTNTLLFDEAKFKTALANYPSSVQDALSGFTLGATLAGGGTGSITGMTGNYLGSKAGTYALTDDGAGLLTAVFTPADGSAPTTSTATVVAGGTNTTLIPGMTLTIGNPMVAGTHTITVSQTSASVIRKLKDFLDGQVGPNGKLSKRQDEFAALTKDITARKDRIQSSIDAEMDLLRRKFAAMEAAQARAAAISQSLTQAMANSSSNDG